MAQFNKHDLEVAIRKLAMLQFFPSDPGVRTEIGMLLAKMVPTKEALEWLVDAFVDRIGEWKGPKELRAVLCTHFKPSDGIEAWSEIPGWTAWEAEQRTIDQHKALKAGGVTREEFAEMIQRTGMKQIVGDRRPMM